VVDVGQTPAHVADQLDVTLAAVSEALSYDDTTLDEIRAIEESNDEAFERLRTSSLKPTEAVE
jgi:predicted transcriptional regulator